MSKILFSLEDRKLLELNPNVKAVSDRSITYTYEFKLFFIEQNLAGKLPREIFLEGGFDPKIIGKKRIEQSAARWKKAYQKGGIIGLQDSRQYACGRPVNRELSPEEIICKQALQIELLQSQVDLLKKLDLSERQVLNNKHLLSAHERFELIHQTISQKSLRHVTKHFCMLLDVSRSGYYAYLNARQNHQTKEVEDLISKELILKAFNFGGYAKGARSIKMVLEHKFNVIFNLKKIRRIMKKYKITCPIRKRNPYKSIAKATQEHRVVPNKLERNFRQGVPGKVLLTDITYLPYNNNMAYLSTIIDGETGEILAYNVADTLKIETVIETVKELTKRTDFTLSEDAFIHSDQGCQYTSPVYQEFLKNNQLGQSMSRKGNCWDNAPQESFFGHMKDHLQLNHCNALKSVEEEVNRYIYYYNNERYQWNRKKMTPVGYRNHLLSCA